MKVEVQQLAPAQLKLLIEIPAEEVDAELDYNYRELRRSVAIPGFRKGKAPLSIVKSRFASHVEADVIQSLIPTAYQKAIVREQIDVIGEPTIDLENTKIVEDQPLTFSATIDIKPQIELPEYNSIQIDKSPINVPRDEVDQFIENLRDQNAVFTPIETDRPVEPNDCIQIDWDVLSTTADDQPDQASAQEVNVELGKESFHPDIESALVGMKAGETKDQEVVFDPPSEDEEPIRTTFRFRLIAITQKELPIADDAFAADLDFENYDKMYAELYNNLVEQRKDQARQEQIQSIADQLIEKVEISVPESLIEKYAEDMLIDLDRQLQHNNLSAEQAGVNFETLIDQYKEEGERQIKLAWIAEEIAKDQQIKVSDDEVETYLRSVAHQQDRDPQKFIALVKGSDRFDQYRNNLQIQKVYDFLIQSASEKQSLIITP